MVNRIKNVFVLIFFSHPLFAQEIQQLSLPQAYELAQKNYPVWKQKELVQRSAGLAIDNLNKGFLPQLSLSGQVTYQSEVTSVDVPVPGIKIESPSRDQYKLLVADVNQLIYDGGVTRQQKNVQQLNANVEQEKVDVELYKLKERINQSYLGILYLEEQLKQVDLIKADLNNGIKRVEAQVNNGVILRSNLNLLKAELLKADQRAIEIKASRKAFVESLAILLNQNFPENVRLEMPPMGTEAPRGAINRPEMKLFSSQDELLNSQEKMVNTKNLPRISLFAQAGYGKPGLNLLKNEFAFYYIGGVRFNWQLGGLYTQKKEKQLVEVNKKLVEIQKETFLLNTNTVLKQQQAEIDKMQQMLASDNDIIDLRLKVKEAAQAQLENGVITANDYLREVNAEDQARLTRISHQLLLLQAQINYQTLAGYQ